MKRSTAQSMKSQRTIIVKEKIEVKPPLLSRIGAWLVRSFAVIGFLLVTSMILGVVLGLSANRNALPSDFVLMFDFAGDPDHDTGQNGLIFDPFAPRQPSLHQITTMMRDAAGDERVSAIAVNIRDGDYSMAMIEEIHAAMQVFHAAGKPSLAYSDSFGLLGNGTGEYVLARAFDKIWLAPQGQVATTGFFAEIPYYKDTLARFGIRAEMAQRHDYKTGPNAQLRNSMSDQQKEMLNDILDNNVAVVERLLSLEDAIPLFDNAPYTAQAALDQGLIDKIAPYWQLDAHFEMADFVPHTHYTAPKQPKEKDHAIALITIKGVILDVGMRATGKANPLGLIKQGIIDPKIIADSILEAAKQQDVKVIVLQVNSPGGSPSGSEIIRQAVLQAKDHGKIVYVAMGAQAASGGYWVSADADQIWALPSTVTGSIGVYGGKYDLSGLWKDWDVNWERASRGKNADIWSMNSAYSRNGRQWLEGEMDRIYDNFLSVVANGRGITMADADILARGRVWTGAQAVDNGLVDHLGGVSDVVTHIRTQFDIPAERAMTVYHYPKPQSFYQRLTAGMGGANMAATHLPAPLQHMMIETLLPASARAVMLPPMRVVN